VETRKQEVGAMNVAKLMLVAVFCSLGAGLGSAAIYQTTDEHGNVVFSDEPSSGSKPVDLPPLPTYSAPKYRAPQPAQDASGKPEAKGYSSLHIQQPEPDATIRDNTGAVPVAVAIEPNLNHAAGHRLQFLLDGQPVGDPGTQTTTSLSNVDRGAHQLQAVVFDASGNELKRSDSVRFYLHRQSVNFPTGPGKPTPFRGQ
jgi:hypothetical protein